VEENYSLFNFEYREGDFYLMNIAIKKPITQIGDMKVKGYYDLETPYGYGGFYSNCNDVAFLKKAMVSYKTKCFEENIIAEFFSFHPYNNFPELHSNLLDVCLVDRQVVKIDLQKSDEGRWLDYASKTRTIIRKCSKILKVEETDDIDTFIEMYYETMEKNNARRFYYFDRRYFERLIAFPSVKLIKVLKDDVCIAMSFIMCAGTIGHYHLSANKPGYSKLNANYLLLEEAFKLAKNQGCNQFLLGGGRTSDKEDNLFKFKKKFSPLLSDFYLGGNVYNREIYERYCHLWTEQYPKISNNLFLKYRLDQ
jgi:hypothetical protein